jgi:predicted small metal-binding protein
MNAAEGVRWSVACRDLGFACEWELRARPWGEVRSRFFDHAKCAHAVAGPTPELDGRLESVRRGA